MATPLLRYKSLLMASFGNSRVSYPGSTHLSATNISSFSVFEMGACSACKCRRKRCDPDCIFAPYFPSNDTQKFDVVRKVFGADNVSKWLGELPVHQREHLVSSLVYEANARVRCPVNGCLEEISFLNNRVSELEMQLDVARNQVQQLQMQREPQAQELNPNRMKFTFDLNQPPFGEDGHNLP